MSERTEPTSIAADAAPATQRSVHDLRRDDRRVRLEALGQLPGHPEVLAEVRAIAGDRADDPLMRVASILFLARFGVAVEVERDAPAAVLNAQRRAAETIAALQLVEAHGRGEPGAGVPRAELLDPPVERLREIESFPLPEEELRRAAAARGESADRYHALGLRCAGREFAVLVRNEALGAERLLSRPAAPAVIAVHHQDEVDHWTAPFDVLTEPDGNGSVRVSVVDSRGRVVYGGSGRADDGRSLRFTIQAADRPGTAAISFEGVLDDGIRLLRGVSDTVVRNRVELQPSPLSPERSGGS